MPPLIGLYSPAPRAGKSTLAAALLAEGYARVRFAGPLKAALAALLTEAGEDAVQIDRMIEGDLKHRPAEALAGRSPRWAMQSLGTEWGRQQIAEDLWLRLFARRAAELRGAGVPVVCDDMRFPNEASLIRAEGGLLVRIERPGAEVPNGHPSEGALEGLRFDLRITNGAADPAAFVAGALPALAAALTARG